MPPKRTHKKAVAPPPPPPEEVHVEVALAELELKVDAMRSEIESVLDSTLSEMRRVIEAAVLRLPARIRGMTMQQFISEYGGDVQVVLETDKKMSRLARTVAKTTSSGAAVGVLAGSMRLKGLGAGRLGLPLTRPGALAAGSHTTTPGVGGGARSRVGPAAASAAPTPSLAAMKSAAAPTPGGFNPHLPKTPAVRRPRRGEMLYAVSENGSPLGLVNVTRGAAARGGSVAASSAHGGGGVATATATDVEVVLDGDVTVGDEQGAARAAQERGADAVVSAIEAMQQQLERMKQAALSATATGPAAAPAPGAAAGRRPH